MIQVANQADFGQDTIRFYFKPGCLNAIKQVVGCFYDPLVPLGDGRYKAVPRGIGISGGHTLEVDLSRGFVIFHYNSSNGRDKAESILVSVRQDLSKRLEVIED